jgi:hypothetical protein
MRSRLVNVRLDSERLRKAQTLRRRGISLSDVVREAIDQQYSELRSTSRIDAKALVREMFEQYPDSSDVPPRDYNVHDRRAARAAVLRKIRPVRP